MASAQVWWVTGSVSLLSDAMESLVNLASALFALAMVTMPLGITQSKEYAEPEWYADLWLTIVWVAYLLVFGMGTILGMTAITGLPLSRIRIEGEQLRLAAGDGLRADRLADRGERARVLPRHAHRERAVPVDQADDVLVHRAGQDHPDDLHGLRGGDPQSRGERGLHSEPVELREKSTFVVPR